MNYRQLLIPKKNGKTRKVFIPDKELLVYQKSKLPYLYRIFNNLVEHYELLDVSHGFIKGKNCITAASKHIGYTTSIMLDIENFFDSVHKDMFKGHLDDIYNDTNLFHKEGFTAQGFSTSPILANIAILPALLEIKLALDKELEEYAFSIYADDICISFSKQEEKTIVDLVEKILLSYSFKLNKKKTRVKYSYRGLRRVLGVNVGETEITPSRKTLKKLRAAKHQQNYKSIVGLEEWSYCKLPKD